MHLLFLPHPYSKLPPSHTSPAMLSSHSLVSIRASLEIHHGLHIHSQTTYFIHTLASPQHHLLLHNNDFHAHHTIYQHPSKLPLTHESHLYYHIIAHHPRFINY